MHKVNFSNAKTGWDEALPIGNGHFGAMLYFEDNKLTCAMNHYDIYYEKLAVYNDSQTIPNEPAPFNELKERAIKAHEDKTDPGHYSYNYVRNPEMKEQYGSQWSGYTHCPTGNMVLGLNSKFMGNAQFSLCLDVEDATICFDANSGNILDTNSHSANTHSTNANISIKSSISPSEDIIITDVEQNQEGIIECINLVLPERRMLDVSVDYHALDSSTFYYIGSFYPDAQDMQVSGVFKKRSSNDYEDKKPFNFIVMVKLSGNEGSVDKTADYSKNTQNSELDAGLAIKLSKSQSFKIITTVVTGYKKDELIDIAIKKLDYAVHSLVKINTEHIEYWKAFWSKSSIELDDKLIEDLWYINLYSLACSNGRGSKRYEQACGLNGLWDIKQPSIWGSSWYWDVNIEQCYWPVYTCNHLELAEPFYKGLSSYIKEGEERAAEYYGLNGIAADRPYPFTFYLTIWPWCAQFYWWHYMYSGDILFLQEQAYPLFTKILKFFEQYLQYDTDKDCFYIFPDISPEQGPVTRNTTICLTCLRFLLTAAIDASKILNIDSSNRGIWENILCKLPSLPIGISKDFGRVINDSEWSYPDLKLAGHASLIMPIYPTGEINKRSDEKTKELAYNTISYMIETLPFSTHTHGWLACAAARMGLGDKAVEILYEKVIAFQLRVNGLFAEETERWMQSCLTMCEPVYNPPLLEAGGSVVSVINEMLLQSYKGIIEVFPACPEGKSTNESVKYSYASLLNTLKKKMSYRWDNASFEGLLAEGGFEISAKREAGHTVYLRIKSSIDGGINIINPFSSGHCFKIKCNDKQVDYLFDSKNNIITFNTIKEAFYELEPHSSTQSSVSLNLDALDSIDYDLNIKYQAYPRIYQAPSGRRVYLGKDKDTDFIRDLDSFTFDFYAGEQRESHMARYRIDFSIIDKELIKDYSDILPRQFHGNGKSGINFKRIPPDLSYSNFTGLGFDNIESLNYIDREKPDSLRRDFISSKEKNAFIIELPKGRYDILFIVGDEKEPTNTKICIDGQGTANILLPSGTFAAESIPVNHRKDGLLIINLETEGNMSWKLSGMIVNRLK